MAANNNPLAGFFRSPKLYTKIPSLGKFYTDEVVEMEVGGELAIFPLTAKDELIMKNPDALLNGEAVAQIIKSCVPAVKQPRKMINNDIEALLVAIQSASFGDDIEVSGNCPVCNEKCSAIASGENALESMSVLEETYNFVTSGGLEITLRPFSYESTVKAGIANFQSTRSLQSVAEIKDEIEQLKRFNESFVRIAALNFELIVDSVASISGKDDKGEEFTVYDRAQIKEFLENCETTIGRKIEKEITAINKIGVNKKVQIECDQHGPFEQEVGFDPVNFFTGS
jgi:hypothetical protein